MLRSSIHCSLVICKPLGTWSIEKAVDQHEASQSASAAFGNVVLIGV